MALYHKSYQLPATIYISLNVHIFYDLLKSGVRTGTEPETENLIKTVISDGTENQNWMDYFYLYGYDKWNRNEILNF